MSDPLVSHNGKLNALNKKIIEVKKKIQLSEGQRKANFEECDAKKRETAEKISRLKKEVKELQLEFARAKNNDEAREKAARLNRESSAYLKKRNLQEAVAMLDEENIRLRKKLDLVKYQSNKQQKRLAVLLQQYEQLMNGKPAKPPSRKTTNAALKKKIIRLENQLHRVSVMQMEADTVRKKYRAVRSSLKADASFYASCLNGLEESIHEQENEIRRLKRVKEEAIELRDTTKESLAKQEVQAMQTTKERETVIQEYRKRVEERKIELERLERLMFQTTRPISREDYDTGQKSPDKESEKDAQQTEMERLEEIFVKLRSATGVSRTEEVLDRFLAQRATKEKLKKMQLATEQEKMELEKKRQQLTAEIEMQKFSETKDVDQNTEKLEKLNKQIKEQQSREEMAKEKLQKIQELLKNIGDKLIKFCGKLHETNGIVLPDATYDTSNPRKILEKLNVNLKQFTEKLGGPEKFNDLIEQILSDKLEVMSFETASEHTKPMNADDQPLFPLFPTVTTPAPQAQPSEDEEDIPSRNTLKRQAQLLVDTKSRRKGFAFKR